MLSLNIMGEVHSDQGLRLISFFILSLYDAVVYVPVNLCVFISKILQATKIFEVLQPFFVKELVFGYHIVNLGLKGIVSRLEFYLFIAGNCSSLELNSLMS